MGVFLFIYLKNLEINEEYIYSYFDIIKVELIKWLDCYDKWYIYFLD